MQTKQPVWKCVGHIGDVDPIAYGGGFVYVDETGVYGPELTYFEPSDDSVWEAAEDKDTIAVQVSRIMLESGENQWWHTKLGTVADCAGVPLSELLAAAKSAEPMVLANLYNDLISYFGCFDFDQYPITITEAEAYTTYAAELHMSKS